MHILLGKRAKEQGLVQMMCKFPKEKFCQECAFLQDLICNCPSFSNLESVTVDDNESSETTESEHSISSEEPLYLKKAKKTELSCMETALIELAKENLPSP